MFDCYFPNYVLHIPCHSLIDYSIIFQGEALVMGYDDMGYVVPFVFYFLDNILEVISILNWLLDYGY